MKYEALRKAAEYTKAHRKKRNWLRVVTGLAAVVVFCTVYALILPVITLENTGEHPLTEDKAYIELKMGQNTQDTSGGIMDGSEPFDKDKTGEGFDANGGNRVVRTFDTVKYSFYYATRLHDTNDTGHYDSARVYFEFLLPANNDQAMFSVDDMAWLKTDVVSYVYEKESITIEGVTYQILHGSFLDVREGSDITAAVRSQEVVIRVLNSKNGFEIQPVFSMWLECNDVKIMYENNIPKDTAYKKGSNCYSHQKCEIASILPDKVTVTCTPRYDVTLKQGEISKCSWAGDFDFSTGNDSALDQTNAFLDSAGWDLSKAAEGIVSIPSGGYAGNLQFRKKVTDMDLTVKVQDHPGGTGEPRTGIYVTFDKGEQIRFSVVNREGKPLVQTMGGDGALLGWNDLGYLTEEEVKKYQTAEGIDYRIVREGMVFYQYIGERLVAKLDLSEYIAADTAATVSIWHWGDEGARIDIPFVLEESVWNGRINGYGIRLMVKGLDAEHGLRGCELPSEGDTIEFDITLVTKYTDSSSGVSQNVTTEFKPLVWSADSFEAGDQQQDGREVNKGGINGGLPVYAAPLNHTEEGASSESCQNGGTWTFADGGVDTYEGEVHRRIHVKVSGYTFDPTHLPSTYYGGASMNDTAEFYNRDVLGSSGTEYWNIRQAVFSTGEMWVVTPFYNQAGSDPAHYITAVKNISDLTMQQSIFAREMEVKDGDNNSKYKKEGKLDQLNAAVTLRNPGTFESGVSFLKPFGGWNESLIDKCFDGMDALKDYATPGTYTDLEAYVFNDGAEGDNVCVAYNLMVKFDNAFFEPVAAETLVNAGCGGSIDSNGNIQGVNFRNEGSVSKYAAFDWSDWPDYGKVQIEKAWAPKILYGTIHEGKGWDHKEQKPDGADYDSEMIKATADDIEWYRSLEDMKADGKECVAVLMEFHNVANDLENGYKTMNHLHLSVHGKIKDTVESGYVYAVTNNAVAWTKRDLKHLVGADSSGQKGAKEYQEYVHYHFPSYWNDNGKDIFLDFPEPTHERSWKRCTGVGQGTSTEGNNGFGTAFKSKVDGNGTFHDGTGGRYYQDNIYVVPYKSEVDIKVAQTIEGGSSRTVYDQDQNQRVVDYMVMPKFVCSRPVTSGDDHKTIYTDATLTVTLPRGLEYYPNTATWGGLYTQDSSCRQPGTVAGGQMLETQIVKNEDESTTLTWVLKNVPLREGSVILEPIHFSCRIGNSSDPTKDVTSGQTLKVQTDIYSAADPGVIHGSAYNNQSSTDIKISKSTALSIIKTADQSVVDLGDTQGFTMKVYNSSDVPYTGWIADILPKSGVGHSSYNGSLRVEEFKIVAAMNRPGLKFYYTTDSSISSVTDVRNLDIDDNTKLDSASRKWTEFQLDENLSWKPNVDAPSEPITAIAYQYTIPEKMMIAMHITLSLPDGKPGDVIHNKLLLNNLLSSDRCQIITRTLEGLTWMDTNFDGIQNDGIEDVASLNRLSGVKVELLKLKNNGDSTEEGDYEPYHYQGKASQPPVVIETGQQVSVLAVQPDNAENWNPAEPYEKGRYKFTDLPAGTYAVRFTDGTGATKITPLIASPSNRGENDTIDSDGIATYTPDRSSLQRTFIPGIVLPTVEKQQVSHYESKYNDSGFYERGTELPQTGGTGTLPYTFSGIAIMGGTLLYYRKRRRKGEKQS